MVRQWMLCVGMMLPCVALAQTRVVSPFSGRVQQMVYTGTIRPIVVPSGFLMSGREQHVLSEIQDPACFDASPKDPAHRATFCLNKALWKTLDPAAVVTIRVFFVSPDRPVLSATIQQGLHPALPIRSVGPMNQRILQP